MTLFESLQSRKQLQQTIKGEKFDIIAARNICYMDYPNILVQCLRSTFSLLTDLFKIFSTIKRFENVCPDAKYSFELPGKL